LEKIKKNSLIRLSKSCIGNEEKNAVLQVLDREYLGMGNDVLKFENQLTSFFNREALCVVNGTAALHLALQACGVGPGDEVLVPSLTYVASFQAISATGAKPVACDVSIDTFTIDIKDLKQRITNKSKVIMPVHFSGGVGDLDEVYSIAKENNLRVVEDAAHAFGTIYNGTKIGSKGDIVCFSFDGIKNITSGEGGAIVTSDKEVLNKVKDARLLGVKNDTQKRYKGSRSWAFEVDEQGWRYHMSNIMAAIGIEQLKKFTSIASSRKHLAKLYDSCLKNSSKIYTLKHDYNCVLPHIYVIRVIGLRNREKLREMLLLRGVETGIHYQPNHYLNFYKIEGLNLFNTNQISHELISLPLHPEITDKEIKYICNCLLESLEKSAYSIF